MEIYYVRYNQKHDSNFKVARPLEYEGHLGYLIVLMKSPAIITENGIERQVKKDTFSLYSPDAHHAIRACGEEYVDDWIHFDMCPNDLKLLEALEIPINNATSLYSSTSISDIIHKIAFEFHTLYSPYKNDIMQLLMQLLFFRVSQHLKLQIPIFLESEIDKEKFGFLLNIRNEIYCSPDVQYSVDGLAKKAFMSKSYFQRTYKQVFGITVTEEIIKSRLNHAKYYLSCTDMTIKEIAFQCGFNSDTYFVRAFKKAVQITPTEYRISL